MAITKVEAVQPFYIKAYDQIIGAVVNVSELRKEIARLVQENPEALQYHLKDGHIVRLLNYSKEKELSDQLTDLESVEETHNKISNYVARKSVKVQQQFTPSQRARARKGH